MPKGVEKDYYIWRFLRQKNTTKSQARKIIYEASRINYALKKVYRQKTGSNPPAKKRSAKPPLSPAAKKALKKKQQLARKILAADQPLKAWKSLEPAMKIFVFNNAGVSGRKKLDHPVGKSEWQELSKTPGIHRMLRYIRKENLPGWKRVLHYPPHKSNRLTYTDLMSLGFGALDRREKSLAEYDFARAVSKAPSREEADRALFWAWKADGDREYLKKLVQSYDINLYTLAGRDALKMPYDLGITPELPGGRPKDFNPKDPIDWSRLKRKIFSSRTDLKGLARNFAYEESVGHYAYIMTKAGRDMPQYFPMPYRDQIKHLPLKRQAILYAIARQESRFIPAAVSSSFALGMMQIMPFLVDHLAKQRNERIDYDDLFDPRVALRLANTHLDYLTSWLYHPLFVAYAYNAGIGYTRRLIRRKDLFENRHPYDPWISLERVENRQANEYGKRVLTNYVIYLNKLGYPIRLTDLLSVVHRPKLTDRFRKAP